MKESYGATGIYIIVVVLIFLFSGYLSFSINRSRIVKVKNEILNIVERANGNSIVAREAINRYLADVGYRSTGTCESGEGYNTASVNRISGNNQHFYCIEEVPIQVDAEEGLKSSYFTVTVFFEIGIPIINMFDFEVSGATKVLYVPKNE